MCKKMQKTCLMLAVFGFIGGTLLYLNVKTVGADNKTISYSSTLARDADPVVFTGADVPAFLSLMPNDIVAWRYDGGWIQIPIQVDERDFVDWGQIYNTTPTGVTELVYTDAGTFTGADSDPTIDNNDEIVFMAKDAGNLVNVFSEPPNVITGTGVELTVSDPVGGGVGYVYLFEQDGSLDPSAGQQYIHYDFNLLSGDYLTTYNVNTGPNPENTVITTTQYSHHFSDRWINDELAIVAGSNVDILDRHKNQFAPGNCFRSEDTFSNMEGAFIINKNGPVRAIRSYVGANSGPITQREHLFYEQRQDIHTYLRVHDIPAMLDYFDYNPNAVGMTYYNSLNTTGVAIDGVNDTLTTGFFDWELVTGAQGSLIIIPTLNTDIVGQSVTSYYQDNATPPETQCTGDAFAYGASGLWLNSTIPCTDPLMCTPANYLEAVRVLYYQSPSATIAEASSKRMEVDNPLQIIPLAYVAPIAPVHAISVSELDIQLDWTHIDPNDGYEIWRSTSPYGEVGSDLLLASLPAIMGPMSYTDTNAISTLDNYYYYVLASNGARVSTSANYTGKFHFPLER